SARQQRLVVVGQLHEPNAKGMQDFDKTNVILHWRWCLQPKKNGGAPAALGGSNNLSLPGRDGGDKKKHAKAVPLLNVVDHLAKVFVIGNRYMYGIEPAFSHLAEDLLRLIAILQIVNARRSLWLHKWSRRWIGPEYDSGILKGKLAGIAATTRPQA